MSITLIEIHERMEDGPLYSPISHVVWFLRCILCQTHFTRLAIDHESYWAMADGATSVSSAYWRDDCYFIRCNHNSRTTYFYHWHMLHRLVITMFRAFRCDPISILDVRFRYISMMVAWTILISTNRGWWSYFITLCSCFHINIIGWSIVCRQDWHTYN